MAEDIVFKVSVDSSGEGAKSLKSLKAEFKQLQAELERTAVGTKAYQQALERLGNVRDEIGDLNQTINALNPEGKVQAFANVAGKLAGGFQAATGAAALFGVQSEELEKTLLRVQAATALSQGIQSVVGLTDAFMVLKATLLSMNPIFLAIVAAVTAIGAAYAVWSENMSAAAKNDATLNNELERQKRLQEGINEQIERELELKRALGLESDKLARAELDAEIKRYAAIRTRQLLMQQISDMDEEQREEYKKISKEEEDAYNKILILKIKLNHEEAKVAEKTAEDSEERKKQTAIRIHKEMLAEKKILDEQAILAAQEQQKEFDEIFKQLESEANENDLEAYVNFEWQKMMASIDVEKKGAAMKKEIDDKARADKEKADREAAAAQLQIDRNYYSAVSDLSSTYFNLQIAAAAGNAKKQEELRKKQFQVEKAVRAVQATIDTYKAINATLAAGGAFATPLAVSIGVAGFANVAKILSQQYNGGAQSASADVNVNTGPQIQTQAPNIGNPLTRLNEQGQNQNFNNRVYVLESDISESQGRVAKLQEQATF